MKAKEPNPKEATNVIANLILPKEDWQLGKTKIFLKVAPLDYVYCEWINLCRQVFFNYTSYFQDKIIFMTLCFDGFRRI